MDGEIIQLGNISSFREWPEILLYVAVRAFTVEFLCSWIWGAEV